MSWGDLRFPLSENKSKNVHSHEKDNDSSCRDTLEKKSITLQKPKSSKKFFYKCKICESCFNTSLKLNEHLKTLHRCPICDNVVFGTLGEIRKHFKLFHPKCTKCGAIFERPQDYKIHVSQHCLLQKKSDSNCIVQKPSIKISKMTNQNNALKPISEKFICGFCKVAFNSSDELNSHMQIHPLCSSCGKRLLNEEILNKHVQGLL